MERELTIDNLPFPINNSNMRCPNCQTLNPDDSRFCRQCGTKLALVCSNCGHENLPGSRFCNNCGQGLVDSGQFTVDSEQQPPATGFQPPAPSPQSRIQRLIPPELAAKLESARMAGAMEGERRVVTMLFCDVKGSTAAAEQLDPEEWTDIMNGAFEYMIRPIYHYEGAVGRLMGDAILAFFGAPIAHEDDPQRAVMAGLEIVEGMGEYRQAVKDDWGLDFDVRVGINTGLVVVGAVGSDLRMEYTAMGDAINLAARMEQTAEPGTVQIAEDTYRLVAPLFDFEELGGIVVKGKVEPVLTYRPLRRSEAPGKVRGLEGLDAPLIGRAEEKAQLDAALANLDNGIGGIVCLIGEAGLGKSRLIEESREARVESGRWQVASGKWQGSGPDPATIDQPPATIDQSPAPSPRSQFTIHNSQFTVNSFSYESGQPYALFKRLIRRVIGARPEDSMEALREKIGRVVGEAPAGEQEAMRRVFHSIFGLGGEGGEPPLEGEAFKGQLYTVMLSLWRRRAEQSPVILVCDDVHWADPASVALLLRLFSLTDHSPMLFICALRPDRDAPGWQVKLAAETDYPHRYTEIALRPLSDEAGEELIDSLLHIAELPPALRARILEKSDGNPFFVEEVVRTLIDSGIVVRDPEAGPGSIQWKATGDGGEVNIPDNLQALLTARIDRLAEDARRTLQLASVVGRSFYRRVLAQLAGVTEELDRHLITLQRSELIREAARVPEFEYRFHHALTQEATYNTILLKQRRIFHRQVAEALESLFPERQEELARTLADHFFEAQVYDRALHYYTIAADSAYRLHAPAEAIDGYRQAILCAGELETTGGQLVHLYSRLGRSLELGNHFQEALENYLKMIEVASVSGNEPLRLASLTAQCIVRSTQNPLYDLEEAKATGEEALALAQSLGDRATEAKVFWGLMLVEHRGAGDNDKALDYGRRSLIIARELDLKEQMAYTLTNLANVFIGRGEMKAAREASQRARALWLELDNTPMLADSYTVGQWLHFLDGDFEGVLVAAEEGLGVSVSIDNVWNHYYALQWRGTAQLMLGLISQAIDSLTEAIRLIEEAGIPEIGPGSYSALAAAYLVAGAYDRAEPIADESYAALESVVHIYRPTVIAAYVLVKVTLGKMAEAQEAIAVGKRTIGEEYLPDYSELYTAEAHLQLALGQAERAQESMALLAESIREAGIVAYLPEILLLQGRALLALGRPVEAQEALHEARGVGTTSKARIYLWQILDALASAETQLGNAVEAERLREESQTIVDFIAEHIEDEELRASFLTWR